MISRRHFSGTAIGTLLLSFLAGMLAHRLHLTHAGSGQTAAQADGASGGSAATILSEARQPPADSPAFPLSTLRSTDTVESLLTLEEDALYGRLALWLVDAPAADMSAFWTAFQDQSDPKLSRAQLELLFSQWTRLDPTGAIAATRDSFVDCGMCWYAWARNEPQAALAAMERVDSDASDAVLAGIGASSPELAIAALEVHPEWGTRYAIWSIAEGLARSDYRAGMEFARQHGESGPVEVLSRWTREDPEAAMNFIHKIPDRIDRRIFVTDFLSAIGDSLPAHLEQEASTWPDNLRQFAMALLCRADLTRDPAGTLAKLQADPEGLNRLIGAIERNSEAIGDIVAHPERLPGAWLERIVRECSWDLLAKDPQAWLTKDLSTSGMRPETVKGLRHRALRIWAGKSPAQALYWLDHAGLSEAERQIYHDSVTRDLIFENPAAATIWRGRQQQPERGQAGNPSSAAAVEKEEVSGNENQATAVDESEAGEPRSLRIPSPREWLTGLAGISPEDSRFEERMSQLAYWNRQETAEAIALFRQLPEATRQTLAKSLADRMLDTFPTELQAEAFLSVSSLSHGEDETNDLSRMTRFSSQWAENDPQAAARWVSSLPPGETKLWTARNVAQKWATYDSASARAWIDTLPEAERAGVREVLEPASSSSSSAADDP